MVRAIPVHHTKRDIAAELLRDAIIRGEFAPGTRLIAEELSQLYQISMTPIREALSLLESEKLVSQLPHKGAVVAAMDRDEVLELYAIRSAVEALAAFHGVAKLTNDDVNELSDLLGSLETFEGSWDVFLDLDQQFHRVIYRAASPRWLQTIETLWQRSRRYMLASASIEGVRTQLHTEHKAIVNACQRREAEAAAAAIAAHLKQSEQRLLSQWSSIAGV